jgi:hypothetical protein
VYYNVIILKKSRRLIILDASTQLISSSTPTHAYSIFVLVSIITFNFYTVYTEARFIFLANRLRKVMPYFHATNFIVAYLGTILSAFTHDLSWTVILMIPTSLFLMITEIKRYKKMRVIKLDNLQAQDEFKKFAKKIYFMQLITISVMSIIAELF